MMCDKIKFDTKDVVINLTVGLFSKKIYKNDIEPDEINECVVTVKLEGDEIFKINEILQNKVAKYSIYCNGCNICNKLKKE